MVVNKCTKHLSIAILSIIFSASISVSQISGNQVSVDVIPIQNLNFGDLVAGVPKHISYQDPMNAGRFEVRVTHGNSLLIMAFLLSPVSLSGPQGATLNLSYTGSDGYYSLEPKLTGGATFDPLANLFFLESGRKYYFYIGGTAEPTQTQRPGSYSGLIMFQVVYF